MEKIMDTLTYEHGDRVRIVAQGDKYDGKVGIISGYHPVEDIWAVRFTFSGAPDFPIWYNPREIKLYKTYEEVKRYVYGNKK